MCYKVTIKTDSLRFKDYTFVLNCNKDIKKFIPNGLKNNNERKIIAGLLYERVTKIPDDIPSYGDIPVEIKDYLLLLKSNPKKAFIEHHNTLEDILTPSEIEIYNHQPPSGTWVLEQALKKKLEEDPDYEVWVPLRYWKSVVNGVVTKRPSFELETTYISNKGRFVGFSSSLHPRTGFADAHGYKIDDDYTNGVKSRFKIHRALACSFITTAKGPLSKLYVNHLDGVKDHNCFLNLEWVTCEENRQHALDTGLTPVNDPIDLVGRMEALGEYFGVEFILSGEAMSKKYGLGSALPSMRLGYRARGCVFRLANKKDLEVIPSLETLSPNFHKYLKRFKRRGKKFKSI